MAQNEKPLFPREPEDDPNTVSDLLKDVKQQLEAEESTSELELPDTDPENALPPTIIAYGPPPLRLVQTSLPPEPVNPLLPEQTPLPPELVNPLLPEQTPLPPEPVNPLVIAILVGCLFTAFIAIWLVATTRSPSPQTPVPGQEKRV
jgi:hypothetical protein